MKTKSRLSQQLIGRFSSLCYRTISFLWCRVNFLGDWIKSGSRSNCMVNVKVIFGPKFEKNGIPQLVIGRFSWFSYRIASFLKCRVNFWGEWSKSWSRSHGIVKVKVIFVPAYDKNCLYRQVIGRFASNYKLSSQFLRWPKQIEVKITWYGQG